MEEVFKIDDKCHAYCCDCIELMNHMIANGTNVDLTITSPPYDSIRRYGNNEWNFDIFKSIANLLYEVTKDGGTLVWVVGDSTVNGSESGTSFKQALYFKEIGFNLHDTMIFEKNSSSFPSSRKSNRYTQIFEYMFILTKGKPKTSNLIIDKKNKWKGHKNWGKNTQYEQNGELIETEDIKEVPEFSPRTNIWKYTTGFNVNYGKHSAVFPFRLVEDHILTWSNENDLVFDPMLGSGTTMFAALKNHRNFKGCEINKEYCDSYADNLNGYLKRWDKK